MKQSKYTTIGLLFILIFIAALLRFWGLSHDLPTISINYDEHEIVENAMKVADGNFRHGSVFRGTLPPYVTGFTIRLVAFINPTIKHGFPTFQQAYRQDKTPFYVIARMIGPTYSVLTMIILFLLAQALLGQVVGLLSVLVFAISVLEIQYAHLISPDSALVFTMTTTLYVLFLAYKKKNELFLLLSAILVGVSAAQKIPGVLLLPLPLLVYRSIIAHKGVPLHTQSIHYAGIVGITILTYILCYPFIFSDFPFLQTKWYEDNEFIFDQLILTNEPYLIKIRSYLFGLVYVLGVFVFLLSIIGIFIARVKRILFTQYLSGFMFFFLVMMAFGKPYWGNYMLPLFPLISIFAALSLQVFYQAIKTTTHSTYICGFCIFIALFPSSLKSIRTAYSYTVPDSRTLELRWLKNHGIDESRIARDGNTSVKNPPPSQLTSKLNKKQLELFDYIVLSSEYSDRLSHPRQHAPQLAAFYRDIQISYKIAAEFIPDDNLIFTDDLTLLTHWNLWKKFPTIRGPRISIYTTHPH